MCVCSVCIRACTCLLMTTWTSPCWFFDKVLEVRYHSLLLKAQRKKVAHGHPSGFVLKVGLKFTVFWFLIWYLNYYTKLALSLCPYFSIFIGKALEFSGKSLKGYQWITGISAYFHPSEGKSIQELANDVLSSLQGSFIGHFEV